MGSSKCWSIFKYYILKWRIVIVDSLVRHDHGSVDGIHVFFHFASAMGTPVAYVGSWKKPKYFLHNSLVVDAATATGHRSMRPPFWRNPSLCAPAIPRCEKKRAARAQRMECKRTPGHDGRNHLERHGIRSRSLSPVSVDATMQLLRQRGDAPLAQGMGRRHPRKESMGLQCVRTQDHLQRILSVL